MQLNTEGYKIMEISKVDFTYKNKTLPIRKLDKRNQVFFVDILKTTIRYLLIKKFVYNLDSFETSPVSKHAEHATSKFTTGRNCSYLVR